MYITNNYIVTLIRVTQTFESQLLTTTTENIVWSGVGYSGGHTMTGTGEW